MADRVTSTLTFAGRFASDRNFRILWEPPSAPVLDASWFVANTPASSRQITFMSLRASGVIEFICAGQLISDGLDRVSLTFTVGDDTLTVTGIGDSTPLSYMWTPSNRDDVIAFVRAVETKVAPVLVLEFSATPPKPTAATGAAGPTGGTAAPVIREAAIHPSSGTAPSGPTGATADGAELIEAIMRVSSVAETVPAAQVFALGAVDRVSGGQDTHNWDSLDAALNVRFGSGTIDSIRMRAGQIRIITAESVRPAYSQDFLQDGTITISGPPGSVTLVEYDFDASGRYSPTGNTAWQAWWTAFEAEAQGDRVATVTFSLPGVPTTPWAAGTAADGRIIKHRTVVGTAPSGPTGANQLGSVKRKSSSGSAPSSPTSGAVLGADRREPAIIKTAATAAVGPTGSEATAVARAPEAPSAPRNLSIVEVGQAYAVIQWDTPADDGREPILSYDIQFAGGPWISTGGSPARVYRLTTIGDTTLRAGQQYRARIRAVNIVGGGVPSDELSITTADVLLASDPIFTTASAPTASSLRVEWRAPRDLGGGTILRYELRLTMPDGRIGEWEPAGTDTEWIVRGLAPGVAYGAQVRAVNEAGAGPPGERVSATPLDVAASPAPLSGQPIPLLPDADRQSMVLRLGNVDCRLTVWWQPWDSAWYASLDAPVNSPIVQSRRLSVNSSLLARATAPISGDIVCRALDTADDRVDPGRDAWSAPSHGLFYVA